MADELERAASQFEPPTGAELRRLRKEQFELERYYHFKLLAESDYKRRQALYVEAYSTAAPKMVRIMGNVESRGFTEPIIAYIRPFVRGKVVVDVGCGYGMASRRLSKLARQVIAVEVNPNVLREAERQARKAGIDNITFRHAWAMETGLPPASADVFYSNDLVEHLHPDDFDRHLDEAMRVLRPGGSLIFVTANGLFGPHDISKYFLPAGVPAEALHLYEPTYAEIAERLDARGFVQARSPALPFRLYRMLPFKRLTERIWLPIRIKVALERIPLIRRFKPLARLFAVNSVFVIARSPIAKGA